MSAAPDSLAAVVEQAFPARSVAVADGVHVIVPVLAAVVSAALAVPSVTTIEFPLTTMVEEVAPPNVTFPDV